MNICIESQLLNHHKRSGLMTYTEGLLKSLIKNDSINQYSLLYYSLHRKAEDMPGPYSRNFSKKVLCLPDRELPGRNWFKNNVTLPYFFKQNNISVYHQLSGYILPKAKKIFKIITVHDLRTLTMGDQMLKQNINQYKTAIESADICTVVSECTKRDVMEYFGINEKKIKVTYLGVDERYKPACSENIQNVLKKFNVKQPYFLSVGSEPRKNLTRIIQAFAQAKISSEYNLVMCCYKDIAMYKQLAKTLNITSRITFLPQLTDSDIVNLYSGSFCFLFPSLYEGFGLPILEAMQCGCPVITSGISACPEVAGNAAILVNPKDTQEIANAIKQICENKQMRLNLIQNGYVRSQLFSWDTFAKQMINIYSMAK